MREIYYNYFSGLDTLLNQDKYIVSDVYTHYAVNVNEHEADIAREIQRALREHSYCIIELDEFDYLSALNPYLIGDFLSGLLRKNQLKINHDQSGCQSIPLHTDAAYAEEYPHVVGFFCRSAPRFGGDTVIVKLNRLYMALCEKFRSDINLLFAADAIIIKTDDMQLTSAILFAEKNGEIGIRYSTQINNISCDERTFEMFDFINQYIHTKENQIRIKLKQNQVLLIDNHKILHGRTAFSKSEQRDLYEFWW